MQNLKYVNAISVIGCPFRFRGEKARSFAPTSQRPYHGDVNMGKEIGDVAVDENSGIYILFLQGRSRRNDVVRANVAPRRETSEAQYLSPVPIGRVIFPFHVCGFTFNEVHTRTAALYEVLLGNVRFSSL